MLPIKQETRDMRTRVSMIEMETTGRSPTAGQFNSRLLITQEGDLFSRVVRGSLGKIVDLQELALTFPKMYMFRQTGSERMR